MGDERFTNERTLRRLLREEPQRAAWDSSGRGYLFQSTLWLQSTEQQRADVLLLRRTEQTDIWEAEAGGTVPPEAPGYVMLFPATLMPRDRVFGEQVPAGLGAPANVPPAVQARTPSVRMSVEFVRERDEQARVVRVWLRRA